MGQFERILLRSDSFGFKKKGELVNVNCAAIPSTSGVRTFGHEKGAFTGADSKKEGRFEASNNELFFR